MTTESVRRWARPPCDCRRCNACAILGIAYPIVRPAMVLTEPDPPPKPSKKHNVPTLFDAIKDNVSEIA